MYVSITENEFLEVIVIWGDSKLEELTPRRVGVHLDFWKLQSRVESEIYS